MENHSHCAHIVYHFPERKGGGGGGGGNRLSDYGPGILKVAIHILTKASPL